MAVVALFSGISSTMSRISVFISVALLTVWIIDSFLLKQLANEYGICLFFGSFPSVAWTPSFILVLCSIDLTLEYIVRTLSEKSCIL